MLLLVRFCMFFSMKKYVVFCRRYVMSISSLTGLSHTGQKFSEKKFCKRVQPYFEISLSSFIYTQFLSIWNSVRMQNMADKNADKKAHTFSLKIKNGYCVNPSKFIDQGLRLYASRNYLFKIFVRELIKKFYSPWFIYLFNKVTSVYYHVSYHCSTNRNCSYILFTKLPCQETAKGPFGLGVKLPPAHCLPHTVEASHCPFNCWTSSRKAVNTNFCSLWLDPTRNRTRVCHFSSRRSITQLPK